MAWYKTGTVSVTNGSTAVTGSGTDFITNAQVGDLFYIEGGSLYEISAIPSATTLTLADNYDGSTNATANYMIVPTQGLTRDLASAVAELISSFTSVRDGAGAGKFADGTATTPGIMFEQDQDTGFYRVGANNIALALAGAKQIDFNSNWSVDATGNISAVGGTFTGNISAVNGFFQKGDFLRNSAGQAMQVGSTVGNAYMTFVNANTSLADLGVGALVLDSGGQSDEVGLVTRGAVDLLFGTNGAASLRIDGADGALTCSKAMGLTEGAVVKKGLVAQNDTILANDQEVAPLEVIFAASTEGTTGFDAAQPHGGIDLKRLWTGSTESTLAQVHTYGVTGYGGGLAFFTKTKSASDAAATLALDIQHDQRAVFKGDIATGAFSSTGASAGIQTNATGQYFESSKATTADSSHHLFYNPNGNVGYISTNGSATAYNTASDPRLKTAFQSIAVTFTSSGWSGACAMIAEAVENKGIGVFDWVSGAGSDVWGYNAHWLIDNQPGFGGTEGHGPRNMAIGEIYEPAEYAVMTDDDDNPILDEDGMSLLEEIEPAKVVTPAGVDQAKRVPLLEAAIYELMKEITDLKERVATLESA